MQCRAVWFTTFCELGKTVSDQLQEEERNICDFSADFLGRFHGFEYIKF